MKIGIIGCGGIGTNVISSLSRGDASDRELVLIDGDHFEASNLDRQVFNSDSLGQMKVDALSKMYNIVKKTIPMYLYKNFEVDMALNDCDFVFILPDNNRARELVMDWCMLNNVPFIVAGNEQYSANAVFWSPLTRELTRGNLDPFVMYKNYRSGDGMRQSCQEAIVERPQTAHANEMAAFMAMHLFYFWTETPDLPDDVLRAKAPIEYLGTKTSLNKKVINDFDK